jgi:hypothetical protein
MCFKCRGSDGDWRYRGDRHRFRQARGHVLHVLFADVRSNVLTKLERAGVFEHTGIDNVCAMLALALAWANAIAPSAIG